MKAIFYRSYGGTEVLEYGEVSPPKIGMNRVLVKVKSVGVNPLDYKTRRGLFNPFMETVFPVVPGVDFAGVVHELGPGVNEGDWAVGDEVYGCFFDDCLHRGTYAEFVATPAHSLARRPTGFSWAEAAALPASAMSARLALIGTAHLSKGETVLIHGASGGTGILAVQLAKHVGARVIGTASEHNHDLLRELGAEPVSYQNSMLETVRSLAPEGLDVVLDCVGKRIRQTLLPLVGERTRFVTVVDPYGRDYGAKYAFVWPNPENVHGVWELAEAGALRPRIVANLPLEKAAEAQDMSQSGHTNGKIVLTVSES